MGSALVEEGHPAKADIAIVLAGDWTGNRVLRAGELIRDGHVQKAIVCGSATYYGEPESDLAVRYASGHGFPADGFIPIQTHALSTETEAEFLVRTLRGRSVRSVLAVTSNFHTARAGRLLRKAGPELQFTMIAAPFPYYQPSSWWKHREGRKTAFNEWLKTITGPFGI